VEGSGGRKGYELSNQPLLADAMHAVVVNVSFHSRSAAEAFGGRPSPSGSGKALENVLNE
jgi:hypothetical protein